MNGKISAVHLRYVFLPAALRSGFAYMDKRLIVVYNSDMAEAYIGTA